MTAEEIRYIRRRDHSMRFSKQTNDSSAILVVLVICLMCYVFKDSELGNRLIGKSYSTLRKERFEDQLNTILIDYQEN